MEALRRAAQKLPIKCKIITRDDVEPEVSSGESE
jgi:large subunit ribosomal protein L16